MTAIKDNRESKEFRKRLTSLVVPIAFQQFMNALVSASDAFMLGFVSQDALSAVSLAGQIMFVYNLFLFAMTTGTSIFAAQYWGKGDKDSVERVLGLSMFFTCITGVIFALLAIFFPQGLMRIFTPDKTLIAMGAQYLKIVGISYFMLSVSQVYLIIMKNCGNATKSAIISGTSMFLNIGINTLLIYGVWIFPRMEIAGAALATSISKFIELAWTLLESAGKDKIKIRIKYIVKLDKTLTKDYWKYTFPVLGDQLAWGCGFTMYSVIMGHMNSDAVAANSIANIVKNLSICVCTGIASGGGILIGNELGKGNLEKARNYGKRISEISIISGVITGLFILAIAPLVVRYANLTSTAKHYLTYMMIVCSYYLVGKSINTATIAGIFNAGGDSRFGFICDTITMWCVCVPLGLIGAFVLKLPVIAVYCMMNIDEIIKLPAVWKHYHKYNWVKDLTRNKNKEIAVA